MYVYVHICQFSLVYMYVHISLYYRFVFIYTCIFTNATSTG